MTLFFGWLIPYSHQMNRSRFEPSQFNQPHGRPVVSDMARGLPDSHQLVAQLMSQEDAISSRVKYTAPVQVGTSGVNSLNPSVSAPIFTGFAEQGILLDSAMPNGDTFYSSSGSFANGTIVFQMPRLSSGYTLTDTVAVELSPFYIPQIRNDITIHPEYLFAQKVYVRISEATGVTSNYQPILGDGATFVCLLTPAVGGSLLATPLNGRITFQRPISTISQLTFTFYRPSAVPNLYNIERMILPKTNLIAKYDIALGLFECTDGDTVSNFVSQVVYAPGNKFAVYITPIIPSGLSWSLPSINAQFGWYASSLDYVNNRFTVNGLVVSPIGFDPNIRFVITIMANRINLDLNVVMKVGAKTNDLTFTA
jgi:hypothetical protein